MTDEPVAEPIMNDIEEANYIKLDGRVFSITPIANQQLNIEAELKQYYNERYKQHIDLFNGGLCNELHEDWDAQIQKLNEYNARTTITIPPEKLNKHIICMDGHEIEEVRAIVYSPNVFKMVPSDLGDALEIDQVRNIDDDTSEYGETFKIKDGTEYDLNDWAHDTVLLVKVRQRLFFPAMYSFHARTNRMNCVNVNTFHNQGTRICTGHQRASAFWNSRNFEEVMNQVNCFSLGSQYVCMNGQPEAKRHHIKDFVKRSTITEVVPEGRGQWRT